MEEKVIINGKSYTLEDLNLLSDNELESLAKDVYHSIGEIAIKKQNYRNNNSEEINSKNYWKRMAAFKTAAIKLQRGSLWINSIRKEKNKAKHDDREHWFFTFYYEAGKVLKKKDFEKIRQMVVDRTGYDIEI